MKAVVKRVEFPAGRRILAVSDIHGNLPWFRALLDKAGYTAVTMAGYDFDLCLRLCREKAPEGGCVLLSPACASFDMFKDFEDRGRIFKEKVMALR